MEELIASAQARHQARGILLDTNVLLLLISAVYQPAMIGKRRLSKYGPEDGVFLANFVSKFSKILTTPHVLTETGNLARQCIDGQMRLNLFQVLHPLFCLALPQSLSQLAIPGTGVDKSLFCRIGFTDSYLAALVSSKELLLTDDLDLYVAAVSTGGSAINFTHMREAAGLL